MVALRPLRVMNASFGFRGLLAAITGFFGVSDSPMAASTTERASASGSVGLRLGFLAAGFFVLALGFVMLA